MLAEPLTAIMSAIVTSEHLLRSRHIRIAERVHERVLAVGGPEILEDSSVPHDLVHDLGKTDGVRVGARSSGLKCARPGISNVALVVGAVDILAVPASEAARQRRHQKTARRWDSRGKRYRCANTTIAYRLGE